jgi:hypothetical protein
MTNELYCYSNEFHSHLPFDRLWLGTKGKKERKTKEKNRAKKKAKKTINKIPKKIPAQADKQKQNSCKLKFTPPPRPDHFF